MTFLVNNYFILHPKHSCCFLYHPVTHTKFVGAFRMFLRLDARGQGTLRTPICTPLCEALIIWM